MAKYSEYGIELGKCEAPSKVLERTRADLVKLQQAHELLKQVITNDMLQAIGNQLNMQNVFYAFLGAIAIRIVNLEHFIATTKERRIKMFNKNENLFMVDIETDGLNHSKNHITSFCIQQFSFEDGAIGSPLHLRIIPNNKRIGDEKTNAWRKEHGVVEVENKLSSVSFENAIFQINHYCGDGDNHFFANHPEFDFGFFSSYCYEYGIKPFWAYNKLWDMGSLIKGAGQEFAFIKNALKASLHWMHVLGLYFENKEQPHNAYYDCIYQIELLRWAAYSRQ